MKIPVALALGLSASTLGFAASLDPAEVELPPVRYGLQLLAATPRQDLRDLAAKTGVGLGLFAEQQIGPSTVLQSRIDFIRFPVTRDLSPGKVFKNFRYQPLNLSADSMGIGVELHQYFTKTGFKNVFLLAGITGVRYEFSYLANSTQADQNGIPIPGQYNYKEKTSMKIALSAGLGYDFDRTWTLSTRYLAMSLDGLSYATLETSLSLRF